MYCIPYFVAAGIYFPARYSLLWTMVGGFEDPSHL